MKRLIIDELFEAILTGDSAKFDEISESSPENAVHIRLIMSSSNQGAASIGLEFNQLQEKCPAITQIFEFDRFFFISKETALQSYLTGGKSNILIDWSFSFDSNFAGKVLDVFFGKNISDYERYVVRSFLHLRNQLSIQTDIYPMLIENVRLRREDPENHRPRDTLAAFKSLDFIDWERFMNEPNTPLKDLITKPWSEFISSADVDIQHYVEDENIRDIEIKSLFANCVLLKLAILYYSSPRSSSKNFSSLITFCVEKLRKIPAFELNIAWQFFYAKQKPIFFGPITGKSSNLIKDIRGMAWDLTHLRSFETMATKSENGSFFLPYFVSFDRKLRDLFHKNPITFMLIDDKERLVLAARKNEIEFQVALKEHIPEDLMSELSPSKVSNRRKEKLDFKTLETMRDILEIELKALL